MVLQVLLTAPIRCSYAHADVGHSHTWIGHLDLTRGDGIDSRLTGHGEAYIAPHSSQ
jgi:hypothetical protein